MAASGCGLVLGIHTFGKRVSRKRGSQKGGFTLSEKGFHEKEVHKKGASREPSEPPGNWAESTCRQS